jgi:hypothetical protein
MAYHTVRPGASRLCDRRKGQAVSPLCIAACSKVPSFAPVFEDMPDSTDDDLTPFEAGRRISRAQSAVMSPVTRVKLQDRRLTKSVPTVASTDDQ